MEPVNPYTALLGGALIGLGATLLLSLNGRIAGISGILNGVIMPQPGDVSWRVVFLAGVLLGSLLHQWCFPERVPPTSGVAFWPMIVGGLLVGYGTRMGNGCTSGHGVCGLGRLSLRSLVATVVFLVAGMVSVFLLRHVMGMPS